MINPAQLEQAVLNLPPAERAQLVLAAWESLESDSAFMANPSFDPEGVALAMARDRDIEVGHVRPLSHAAFLEHTGGAQKDAG